MSWPALRLIRTYLLLLSSKYSHSPKGTENDLSVVSTSPSPQKRSYLVTCRSPSMRTCTGVNTHQSESRPGKECKDASVNVWPRRALLSLTWHKPGMRGVVFGCQVMHEAESSGAGSLWRSSLSARLLLLFPLHTCRRFPVRGNLSAAPVRCEVSTQS